MVYMKFKAGGLYKGGKDNGPETGTKRKYTFYCQTGFIRGMGIKQALVEDRGETVSSGANQFH